MPDSMVRPFYRLIANGVEGKHLKATLIITPEPVMGDVKGIPFKDWPQRMARILGGVADQHLHPEISLQTFATEGNGKTFPIEPNEIVIVGHNGTPPTGWSHVNALWQKSIVGAGGKELPDPWEALRDDIERSLTGEKHSADPKPDYQGKINQIPDAKNFDGNGAIVARRPNPVDKITVSGVVANKQADLAVDEERVRAQRVLRRMLVGPGLPGDDESFPDDGKKTDPRDTDPKDYAGKNCEERKPVFDEAIRKRMFGDFKENVGNTNRAALADRFTTIKEIIKNTPGAASAAKLDKRKPPQRLIASADRVMKGTDAPKLRAGHAYGGWLQSVERSKQVSDTQAYEAHTTTAGALTTDQATALERVRGVYYSFQGDPFLSRLFCLAADVTLPIHDELSKAILKGAVYLYLASERCEEQRKTAQVYTAAKLHDAQFWPVSRFDLPDTKPRVRSLVEQRDGVWMLGDGYGTGYDPGPRYHLASVDFRRSVDSTADAIDRGQRHNTAGITILDRDRGEQIARDLAISSVQAGPVCDQAQHQCNVAKRHCVVLWAEELTIGRRLDVAVVKERQKVEALEWRSLMQRRVAFEVEPAVAEILKQVTGKKSTDGHFHDEASFQVVTRSMPLLGEPDDDQTTERPVEAVADEALLTWDGTPLAALARQDSDENKPHDGPRLPFRRTQSLETDGAGRPSPLRYGVGYAFSMRSAFVGGGSPSVKEASAFHRANGGTTTLPPAIKIRETPVPTRKRFLRHDSIDAPPVLLPRHLVENEYGLMGFEVSDRVILRSNIPTPTVPPKELPDRYVDVKDRARPDSSMRIFVAPAVALDTAIRHRKLDHNGPEVMRGGLRNVLFDPAKDGFPLVVTERAAEFNGDFALVKRGIAQNATNAPAKDKKNGATVFVPGGPNSTPPGKVGYLPDPAAENMVVRLRIRGSDRYLAGAWITPLYDNAKKIVYPHALPLAVSVEKLSNPRPLAAGHCSEILLGDPKATRKLALNGKFGATGVEVRHLTVRLAPGEDFDLEVVCVPDSKTLAQTFSLPETIALQLDHSAQDACGADDLVCLCGPGSQKRLADLRNLLVNAEDGQIATEVGLGGWAAPGLVAIEAVAKELINTIQSNWQIEELAAVQSVRVTHAINAPLKAPDITLKAAKRPAVKKDDPIDVILNAPSEQGAVVALLQGRIALDLEQTGAFELVVKAAATGGKPFDDKSRSRSLLARRSGRWPEVLTKGGESHFVSTQDVLGFKVAADGSVTFPRESVTLLRIDNLPDPRALPTDVNSMFYVRPKGRLTEIDLAPLHAAAIAKQTIDIPIGTDAPCATGAKRKIVTGIPFALEDTRARKISVKLVAISRFGPLFETASYYAKTDDLLNRRQALVPGHQSSSSQETEVWIPSTIRPARCDARPPAPTFVFERRATKLASGLCQHVMRTARTRLHFGRGMFSSGEGERIGIVLWPPHYAAQDPSLMEKDKFVVGGRNIKLPDFDDADLGPGGRFVTRWGGDPIRRDASPQSSNLIPASALRDLQRVGQGPHRPNYVPHARMPIDISEEVDPATGKVIVKDVEPPEFLDVSLLTYEPCFDLDREEWYVDVDLHPSLATDPFVRFGLVRYQEHSIDQKLMMSEPISVWAQVLPQRKVSLTHTNESGDIKLKAVVRGQAYLGVKPVTGLTRPKTPDEEKTLALLAGPSMQMTIVHEGFTADKVLTRTPIGVDATVEVRPKPVDGLMQWDLEPKAIEAARIHKLGRGLLVAYIEEIEKRMPATYSNEPISPEGMLAEKTIVSSGPRFSARIVFHES
jgi:hypothetical protein